MTSVSLSQFSYISSFPPIHTFIVDLYITGSDDNEKFTKKKKYIFLTRCSTWARFDLFYPIVSTFSLHKNSLNFITQIHNFFSQFLALKVCNFGNLLILAKHCPKFKWNPRAQPNIWCTIGLESPFLYFSPSFSIASSKRKLWILLRANFSFFILKTCFHYNCVDLKSESVCVCICVYVCNVIFSSTLAQNLWLAVGLVHKKNRHCIYFIYLTQ